MHSFKSYASGVNNKQRVIIYFDWTVRILNHRGFCARLVRKLCVPDTVTNIGFLKQINKTQAVILI